MGLAQKISDNHGQIAHVIKEDSIPVTGFFVGIFADVRDAAQLLLIFLSIFAVALNIYLRVLKIKKGKEE